MPASLLYVYGRSSNEMIYNLFDTKQIDDGNLTYTTITTETHPAVGGAFDAAPGQYHLVVGAGEVFYSVCLPNDPTNTERRWRLVGSGPYTVEYFDVPYAAHCGGTPNPLEKRLITPVDATLANPKGRVHVELQTKNGTAFTATAKGVLTLVGSTTNAAVATVTFVGDSPASAVIHQDIPNLDPGDYVLTVTATDNQPASTYPVHIGQPAVVACDLAVLLTEVNLPDVNPKPPALGTATGELRVTATGNAIKQANANASVRIRLTQGENQTDYQQVRTVTIGGTATFTGLAAGIYLLTAEAGTDCKYPPLNTDGTQTPRRIVIPEPSLEIGDQLTFLPWVQSKLARAATTGGVRATLTLAATLATDLGLATPDSRTELLATTTTAEIYGPGDVLGLNERAILGTTPAPDAAGFSPLQLAAIEFKEEDLPWRYSPTKTGTDAPLPWCFLLVLKASEFDALPLAGQPLPSIRVHANGPYPSTDPFQQQLWAHVQVNASLGDPGQPGANPPVPPRPITDVEVADFLENVLPTHPDLAYSRVFCPRRLEESTAYHAFLLPAIEAGRRGGLGLPYDATHNGSAIAETALPRDFPVYYQWQFTTGVEDDFEALAGQLYRANDATRTAPAPGLAVPLPATTYALPMPSLLRDPAAADPASTAEQELAAGQYLYGQLVPGFTLRRPATGRPVITPPLYGRAYMVSQTLVEPRTAVASSWKHAVNLDPRYRALAALGAQVIQDNQEEYVRRAWEQVQDILLANEKLRGLQYGLRTATGLRDQHLPLDTTTTATGSATGSRTANFAAKTSAPASDTTASEAIAADGSTAQSFAARAAAPAPAAASASLADYGLHLTGLSLSRTRVSAATAALLVSTDPAAPNPVRLSAREAIRRSSTPLAAFSPAFRRILKPFGKYQAGEAGRPLRPTQPEPALDTLADLRQAGTSLRQRDGLLSRLAAGQLTAAPVRAEQVRAYQFSDELVDRFLKNVQQLSPSPASIAANNAPAVERFRLAFADFRNLGQNAQGEPIIVGFKKPQYVRPALPLAELKNDVATGTEPGPVVLAKIKQVAPAVPVRPVLPGDFEGQDYNATDFYVGDYDEPVPALAVRGDWATSDFAATDFVVDVYAPADAPAEAEASTPIAVAARSFAQVTTLGATATTTVTTGVAPATALPVIQQAQVFPVFKDAMGEPLRQRHPELFVPGLSDFPTGGIAVLGVNQAFIEAYMVGLNHALGSELRWRGFPVDVRGTFFQQFWDVSEHLHQLPEPVTPLTAAEKAAQEAGLLDIKPLDQWVSAPLGSNAPLDGTLGAAPLRLAIRSELLRRYPTLVIGLQPGTAAGPDGDPAQLLVPRQRLAVGQDLAVVTFAVTLDAAIDAHYYLVLMERPGQPQFGLDEHVPPNTLAAADPLGWDQLSWEYLGTNAGATIFVNPAGKPHASAEPAAVAHLTDSAVVAYALFQEPVLAAIPVRTLLS